MDYRNTLNLPSTKFPMRANLPQREPEILKRWETMDLYKKIVQSRQGDDPFVLHDGPPYANGAVHLGTGLNKILKDMVNKAQSLLNRQINYRPGWDCHGLPIELNVTRELSKEEKKNIKRTELRRKCRNFALKFVEKHKKSFKRLGVVGEFDRPYLTLANAYESEEIRQFNNFVKAGIIYQGMKPIHWCSSCETALAEAEVEYEDHTSPSIFVRFPLDEESESRLRERATGLEPKPVHVVIWTTTPWTLPANRAVCLHPNLLYRLVPTHEAYLLIAEELTEPFTAQTGVSITGDFPPSLTGGELEALNLRMKHPLAGITVPMICGTHVTLEQGTGAVHTAPGHGHEDYIVGQSYGLEVYAPVSPSGHFTQDSPCCAGMRVQEANQPILDILKEKHLLIYNEPYQHAYPHCWRCKNPIIFRATRQWFASLEKKGLRQRLLDAIDQVQWIPSWGRQRIHSMVENRQEWCISRQRAWGVPIPAVYIGDSEEGILDEALIEQLAQVVEEEGTDYWFRAIENPQELEKLSRLQELLSPGQTLEDVRLERDILDVWFDSGVSHHAVMAKEENIYPADMYLEGSDQHRGWFQSALVTAIAAGYGPPYRAVLTHGFTVDENGHKLSKSRGNYVDLDELINNTGVDVLRLWVSASDFRQDMSFSQDIFKRVTESYRRIRNTARFLLGNLYDFSWDDAVPEAERFSLDRWIVNRWRSCKKRMFDAYSQYEFHRIYYELNNFCAVDLSARYLDIIKDRLYIEGKTSLARKSGQTALAEILVEMTACTAPVLSFTSEEIWQELINLNLVNAESVFTYRLETQVPEPDVALMHYWGRLFDLRAEAVKAIEHERQAGNIGHSLDCGVVLQIEPGPLLEAARQAVAQPKGDDLASLLITSHADVGPVDGMEKVYPSEEMDDLKIGVYKAKGQKCPRCWHYRDEVGTPGCDTCERCKAVLETEGLAAAP